MLVLCAYERHIARFYLKHRNIFQDRLEKVLPMIRPAVLQMKERHARILFHKCHENIGEASLIMKQKRAKRMFSMVFPRMLELAKIKFQHRQTMQDLQHSLFMVAGTKSMQRMRLDHILRVEFLTGIRDRQNRQKMRDDFYHTVLSFMMDTVNYRQMYAERIHYANIWESIMMDVLTYQRPIVPTRKDTDFTPYMMWVGVVCLFWILVFGMFFFLGKTLFSFLQICRIKAQEIVDKGNNLLTHLEVCYEHNHPMPSRQQKRHYEKLEKKLRKKKNTYDIDLRLCNPITENKQKWIFGTFL